MSTTCERYRFSSWTPSIYVQLARSLLPPKEQRNNEHATFATIVCVSQLNCTSDFRTCYPRCSHRKHRQSPEIHQEMIGCSQSETAIEERKLRRVTGTHSIEVTTQFGLCNAVASDIAPSSPMSLSERLFHVSTSVHSWALIQERPHSISVTLQFGLRNALASDFAPSSPIWLPKRLLMSVSGHSRANLLIEEIAHVMKVTLQVALCNALASDFAPSFPMWLPERLFDTSTSVHFCA